MHEYLHWGNPGALKLLWLIPLLIGLLGYAARARRRALETMAAPSALSRLVAGRVGRRRRTRALLTTAAMVWWWWLQRVRSWGRSWSACSAEGTM